MKGIGAIAATQAAQNAVITQSTVYAASLAAGCTWLLLGATGGQSNNARSAPEAFRAPRAAQLH